MNMNNKSAAGLKYPTSGCKSAGTTNARGLVISMPEGLPKLLEYLARETLRAQPDNVTEYIYTLVTQLLAKRDGADAETPASASDQKQGQTQKSEDVPSAPDVEVEEPEARVEFTELSTASKIKLSSESASQVKESKPPDEPEEEVSDKKEALAAAKIQAGFRGYKTRKTLKLAAEEEKRTDEEIAAELKSPLQTIKEESFDLMNASAIKIQACFRGYLVRRDGRYMHLHSKEIQPEPNEAEMLAVEAEAEMLGVQPEIIKSEVSATEISHSTEMEPEELKALNEKVESLKIEAEKSMTDDTEAEIVEPEIIDAEFENISDTEAEIVKNEVPEVESVRVELVNAETVKAAIGDASDTESDIVETNNIAAEIDNTEELEAEMVESEVLNSETEQVEPGKSEDPDVDIMKSEDTVETTTPQKSLESIVTSNEEETIHSGSGDPNVDDEFIQEYPVESELDTKTEDDTFTNTSNTNNLTYVQMRDLEDQILPADPTETLLESATDKNVSDPLDTENSIEFNSISSEIQGQGNASPAISPEPPKTPGESLESSDLNEKVAELLVILKEDEKNSSEKVESTTTSAELNPDYEIETSVDEPEENIPKSESEIECEKGTMTLEIPIMDATTATEVVDDILSEAENIVSTKSTTTSTTPTSPPNIIHESLAAVEVSESLVDSIIQEVGTTLLAKSDSDEIPEIVEEKPEPVVMRRKSKRDSAMDKKTKSQYRSGVVGLEEAYNNLQKEQSQLPSVDEVEAIVEHEMLDQAATKIQAGFRGYKARKSINKASTAASKIQAGFRGFKARKTMANEKNAVIKIQATVRGFLARRRLAKAKQMRQRRRSSTSSLLNRRRKSSTTLNAAAVRIQAAYRGYRVRRISPLPQDDVEINNELK